jgi:hypothetical protein
METWNTTNGNESTLERQSGSAQSSGRGEGLKRRMVTERVNRSDHTVCARWITHQNALASTLGLPCMLLTT